MPTTAAEPRPLPHRIRDLLIAPRRLFTDFRTTTPWVDVLIVSTALAVLGVILLPDAFFVEQMQDAVTRRGEPVELTSSPEEIARWGRYLGMLTAAVVQPLFAFALAGVLSLLFSVLGRSPVAFRQHLALASHALLIHALGTLLTLAAQRLTADPELQATLGRLLPGSVGGDGLIDAVLDGLNLFTLWMLVLLGLGVSVLDRRFSWPLAAALLVGLYLVLDVATALLVL